MRRTIEKKTTSSSHSPSAATLERNQFLILFSSQFYIFHSRAICASSLFVLFSLVGEPSNLFHRQIFESVVRFRVRSLLPSFIRLSCKMNDEFASSIRLHCFQSIVKRTTVERILFSLSSSVWVLCCSLLLRVISINHGQRPKRIYRIYFLCTGISANERSFFSFSFFRSTSSSLGRRWKHFALKYFFRVRFNSARRKRKILSISTFKHRSSQFDVLSRRQFSSPSSRESFKCSSHTNLT